VRVSEQKFDMIFFNAKVVTLDPFVRDASLVAVKGDRIAIVGGVEMLAELKANAARVVDCSGRRMLPGFVDAHCHVTAYAESIVSVSLSPRDGIRSIADIKDRIREACLQACPGEWIRGKGYNEFYLDENRHPNRWDLDTVAPSNPIKLTHRSGHAHVLNSLALQIVGVDASTGDPPGGIIERDLETGLPTGLLFGMGGYLSERIPGLDEFEIQRGLARANEKLLSCGITSVQDASSSNDLKQWKRFDSWKRAGLFAPRLTMMLGSCAFSAFEAKSCVADLPETDLRLGAVKIMAERVTGSLEPSQEKLTEIIGSVHSAGFQVAVHAVDRLFDQIGNPLQNGGLLHARRSPGEIHVLVDLLVLIDRHQLVEVPGVKHGRATVGQVQPPGPAHQGAARQGHDAATAPEVVAHDAQQRPDRQGHVTPPSRCRGRDG